MKDKGKWRQFSKEEIIKLYTGEYSQREINSMNKQIIVNNKSITSLSTEETKNSINIITNKSTPLKGLFFHIGDFNSNCFGAIACLELLCRLTNYEFNPECDLYIYLLKTRPYDYLNEMRLGEYMKLNKRKCVEMSFKIIKLLINDEKNITKIMRKLNCDEEIIEKSKAVQKDKQKFFEAADTMIFEDEDDYNNLSSKPTMSKNDFLASLGKGKVNNNNISNKSNNKLDEF